MLIQPKLMSDTDRYSKIFPPISTIKFPDIEPLIQQYGLPLHIIFKEKIAEQAKLFQYVSAKHYPDTMICFAVKSNPCMGAIKAMKVLGLGIDAVSEYELEAAINAGIPTEKIVCNGNAKTDNYLHKAISRNVLLAVDSDMEMKIIEQIASEINVKARILLRISRMPLDGLTSADQSTASAWTKFGFPYDEVKPVLNSLRNHRWIKYHGISAHIGTQICDLKGYIKLLKHMVRLVELADTHGLHTNFIDIGGGFPISYLPKADWENFQQRLMDQLNGIASEEDHVSWDNDPMGFSHFKHSEIVSINDWKGKAYWSPHPGSHMLESLLLAESDNGISIGNRLKELGTPTLIIEPGRSLIGAAGVTLAEVMSVKKVMGNSVIMLDIGIVNHGTNLITSDIYPVKVLPELDSDKQIEAFIGGRLCFTGDMISKAKIKLNRLPHRGELLAIYHTGAYCADHFSSNSCGYSLPAKVAVDGQHQDEVWRERQGFNDVFK
jgi:diaminopimelate decarboxylase